MALPKFPNRILRRSIAGMEGMWSKMWDPPRSSPPTPEVLNVQAPGSLPPGARVNPVPSFMAAALGVPPAVIPNTIRRSLIGEMLEIPTWDGQKVLNFMAFDDPDFFPQGVWPGPTIRVPRGVIFHCETQGKGPPPHTIHWHGLEPTPMNDGVGHCSMEIGQYTYQLQPNFIGTYFYHCHRNTVQHFEFGLYGMFLVEPPDAFDPANPNRGGYPRRTAANVAGFPEFEGTSAVTGLPRFIGGDATYGVGGAGDAGVGDPKAFTVEYDQECLWVLDDRDSTWSELADNAKSFYPGGPNTGDGPLTTPDPARPGENLPTARPGFDDQFPRGFFHDFNADYWFVTGVPVPAAPGGTGTINPAGNAPQGGGLPNGEIPAALNSGVEGMRIDVDADVGETVLVRCLNGAYNSIEVSFPIDVVIIAFDGRALGVPPFGKYNHAFVLPANTPYRLSTARRFDALIRSSVRVDDFATVRFYDTRGLDVRPASDRLRMTARIPFKIN